MSKIEKLLIEYKEEKRSLELGIKYLIDKNYAIGKLEKVNMIIADLEKLVI